MVMENNLKISSGAVTDRGLSEKRPQNEDSFLEVAKCGIYAVADGVGGAQAGEVASQMAVEILGEAFTNRPPNADAEIVMRTAFERANTAIFQMARELPQLSTMATTVAALHLDGNVATIGHVGDSRLYRVDRDGSLYRETDDHSMVAEEVRAGRMTEEQAENHPSRNIISRALGAEADVAIDLKTILIEPGTAFLICTDGITRHVGDQEIKGVLTFGGSPHEICDYLKDLCYERGAEDNLTAVVVKTAAAETALAASANSYSDSEEPTVASARASHAALDDDEGELLELETLQMDMPGRLVAPRDEEDLPTLESFPESASDDTVERLPELTDDNGGDDVSSPIDHDPLDETYREPPPDATIETNLRTVVDESLQVEEPAFEQVEEMPTIAARPEAVPEERMAPPGISASDAHQYTGDERLNSGMGGKMAAAAGLLILGSLIGLGVYHFGLAPVPPQMAGTALPSMQSENIEFTAFEKNRRLVDLDPEAYLGEVPAADDAEDYYLVGRANLLKGDFPQARVALIEAQKRVSNAPATNFKVLAADIAVALTIANDPSLQTRLKSQIDSTMNASSPSIVNSNR